MKRMIEIDNSDAPALLDAIEAQLTRLGAKYDKSWAADLEVAALRRVATSLDVEFDFESGAGSTFSVKRAAATSNLR